jgi:hypothetical protein
MQFCATSKRLYTMHDCTFLMLTPTGQRNALQAVDVETQTVVATAHEFSEQYELICMAPLGQAEDWGNELVAGAVHGSALLFPSCHAIISGVYQSSRVQGTALMRAYVLVQQDAGSGVNDRMHHTFFLIWDDVRMCCLLPV